MFVTHPEVSSQTKRRKKIKDMSISELCSLPNDLAMICLAKLSRLDQAALAIASKSHRSLITSPELCRLRWHMGCSEEYLYVCMRILPEPTPSWFILTPNRRLIPIPSNPYQAPESSSFVVVDWGIYVIGGIINGIPTSDVSFFDLLSHTWGRVPSMNTPRASASANFIDGKIYVFGGCGVRMDSLNWAEKFDTKTQTWVQIHFHSLIKYLEIQQSVVIMEKKKKMIYALNEEGRSVYFMPGECSHWISGKRDSNPGIRKDLCVIGQLLYCHDTRGSILWCKPNELVWKEVKGLEELQNYLYGSRQILNTFDEIQNTIVKYDIDKLCTNSVGNIVIFWNSQLQDPERLELRSAKISVERREGDEIWGKIEWSGSVFNLDPLSRSYSIKWKMYIKERIAEITSDDVEDEEEDDDAMSISVEPA